MSKEALVFYGDNEMRTAMIDKQIWWVLADVCKVIGVKNNRDVAKKLDDDEKADVDLIYTSSSGAAQKRKYLMINEPGLYHVLLTSRSEKAKKFQRWVTHDVLPRIRKYGYYKLAIAEQKTNALNGIMNTLGVTALEKKYYKMALPELKREVENLKNEKAQKEEFEKVKEKYPYTYGDIFSVVRYYKFMEQFIYYHGVTKNKKYCYVCADGTLLFSELFKERAKKYVSDSSYEWEK